MRCGGIEPPSMPKQARFTVWWDTIVHVQRITTAPIRMSKPYCWPQVPTRGLLRLPWLGGHPWVSHRFDRFPTKPKTKDAGNLLGARHLVSLEFRDFRCRATVGLWRLLNTGLPGVTMLASLAGKSVGWWKSAYGYPTGQGTDGQADQAARKSRT